MVAGVSASLPPFRSFLYGRAIPVLFSALCRTFVRTDATRGLNSSLPVPGAALPDLIRSWYTSAPDFQAGTLITCAHVN